MHDVADDAIAVRLIGRGRGRRRRRLENRCHCFFFHAKKKTKTRKKVPPDSWRSETRRRHSSGFLLFFFLATRPTWNTPAECVLLLADVLRSATRWSQQKKRERERVKRPARDLHCFVFGFGLFFLVEGRLFGSFLLFQGEKKGARRLVPPPPPIAVVTLIGR